MNRNRILVNDYISGNIEDLARISYEKQDLILKNIVLSLYRWVEGIVIRKVDVVIGTGEGLAEQAMTAAPKQKVHHIFDIPSSCLEADPKQVEVLRTSFREDPDEVIALYAGSFAVYQGIDLMFESLFLALKDYPNLRLIVIGGTQDQIDIRNEWLEQRGIREKVHFVGFVTPDRLPGYISSADFLLSPRIYGINTPLKLLDYLKSGKAILATDNVANRRIVDDNVALLQQASPKSFAQGMIKLVKNGHLRHSLGIEGRKLIDNVYNYSNFRTKIKNCYDTL